VDATDSSGNKTRFFKTKNDRYFGPAEKFAPGETNPEIPEKSTVIISDGALRKAEPPLRTVSTAWIMILAQQVCGIPASETVDALENIYLTPPSK
jgi:hypothetical protein